VPVNRCISDIIWYFPYALQAAVTADVTIPTCFPNLVELGIVGCSRVMHLEALPTLSNLRSLDFERSSCWKADMSVLTSCTKLEQLNLSQSGLMDLSPLSACINLVNVNLRVSQTEDISALSACTKLEWVNLSSNMKLQDISPLSTLTNLRYLNLGYCLQIASLAPLSMCTSLLELDNSGNELVQDISPLSTLTNLRCLNICYNMNLASLSPLSMCTSLQLCDLTGNRKLGLQIQVLEPCRNLHTLVVDRCEMPDTIDPFVLLPIRRRTILSHTIAQKSTYTRAPY
jgi:Leucine-rich repeat (LRR) protein